MRFCQPNFYSKNCQSRWYFSCFLFLLFFFFSCCNATAITDNPDPLRLKKAINRFIWQDAKNSYPEQAMLFIGSSSIYRWKTALGFPRLPVINRGIAGTQISDINYYYETIIKKYNPAQVIFYCGDNDIAAGKKPQQVLSDFQLFSSQLKKDFPTTTLFFLTIKPSPARWALRNEMSEANRLVEDYCHSSKLCIFLDTATPLLNTAGLPDQSLFARDGLHLNMQGYRIWENILRAQLNIAVEQPRN